MASPELHRVLNALALQLPGLVWDDAVERILAEFTAERERCANVARKAETAAFHEACEGDSACFTWMDRSNDAKRIREAIEKGGA